MEPTVELALQRTHPQDVSSVTNTFARAAQDRNELDFEHRLLMLDGRVKNVRVIAHISAGFVRGR